MALQTTLTVLNTAEKMEVTMTLNDASSAIGSNVSEVSVRNILTAEKRVEDALRDPHMRGTILSSFLEKMCGRPSIASRQACPVIRDLLGLSKSDRVLEQRVLRGLCRQGFIVPVRLDGNERVSAYTITEKGRKEILAVDSGAELPVEQPEAAATESSVEQPLAANVPAMIRLLKEKAKKFTVAATETSQLEEMLVRKKADISTLREKLEALEAEARAIELRLADNRRTLGNSEAASAAEQLDEIRKMIGM